MESTIEQLQEALEGIRVARAATGKLLLDEPDVLTAAGLRADVKKLERLEARIDARLMAHHEAGGMAA